MRQIKHEIKFVFYFSYIQVKQIDTKAISAFQANLSAAWAFLRARRILVALTSLSVLGLAVLWNVSESQLMEWKRSLPAPAYFSVLAIGATLGLPAAPFYLAGGVLFGTQVALIGVAAAVLAMQVLSFMIARGPLRRWSSRLAEVTEQRFASGALESPAARILVLRLLPAVPTVLKNYASASMGTTFPVFLAVSWPVAFLFAAAMVLLGDSAATGRLWEAALAAALVLPLLGGAWWLRSRGFIVRAAPAALAHARIERLPDQTGNPQTAPVGLRFRAARNVRPPETVTTIDHSETQP